MNKKKYALITILFLLMATIVFAQDSNIDANTHDLNNAQSTKESGALDAVLGFAWACATGIINALRFASESLLAFFGTDIVLYLLILVAALIVFILFFLFVSTFPNKLLPAIILIVVVVVVILVLVNFL